MVHLRIVVPPDRAHAALDRLEAAESVCNVITLPAAAQRPDGDVILADVAREDASVVLADLKELRIHEDGSIALEGIDTHLSAAAANARSRAKSAAGDGLSAGSPGPFRPTPTVDFRTHVPHDDQPPEEALAPRDGA